MKQFITLVFLLLNLQANDDAYTLGEGAQVSKLPLYLGGYVSLDYKSSHEEKRYRLDDIALLGYGNLDKFSYMAEIEFKEFYVYTQPEKKTSTTTQNHRLYLERLYVDYSLNNNYTLRVGKYNSPIGLWNLLPINVLRETTSNPVVSSIVYPKFTTGVNISYSSYTTAEIKVDLMLQNSKDFDNNYNNYKIDRHYGFGVSYEQNDFLLKINGGTFHNDDTLQNTDTYYYFLLSTKYEEENYKLSSEIGRQQSDHATTTSYAGYLQALYHFDEKHSAILRGDFYNNKSMPDSELLVLGYTYRPLYPIALKSEYQLHSKSEYNQLLLSFSVLF